MKKALARLASLVAVAIVTATTPMSIAEAALATFNVRDFGAVGNGSTLDDDAIDRAINAANAASGGGTVLFPAGTYQSRTIHLKSNVTLQLDSGATIRAASSGFDPPEPNPWSQYQDFGHSHFHNSLMWGNNITNFAIVGTGTIDGVGLVTANSVPSGQGDKILTLTRCANVTLRDVTFRRGGHFAVLMNGCHDVLYDNVKVFVTEDRDGINSINSWDVEIRNSRIEASDDALAFKSDFALGQTFTSENIYVHHSTILSTENNATQFGVESCGSFRNVRFEDIAITGAGKAGIGIVSHDGGSITDVRYARITMNRVSSPIFIRLGGRGSCPGAPPPGQISNITISDVTGTNLTTPAPVQGAPEYASSFIGSPGAEITDVSLVNVKLTVPGGHSAAEANLVPPENRLFYRPREWGNRPAYGFWMRHVHRITFTNTEVQFDRADGRPAFATDSGRDVQWVDSRMERSAGAFDLRFTSATGYSLAGTTTTTGELPRVRAAAEAETATISQGVVESNHAGFSGTGFVNTNNAVGSFVEWTVDAARADTASLIFRFANGTTVNRPMSITVNGAQVIGALSFPGTGAWTTWQNSTASVTLAAGVNTIRATSTTANGGPNLDYLAMQQ